MEKAGYKLYVCMYVCLITFLILLSGLKAHSNPRGDTERWKAWKSRNTQQLHMQYKEKKKGKFYLEK